MAYFLLLLILLLHSLIKVFHTYVINTINNKKEGKTRGVSVLKYDENFLNFVLNLQEIF